MKLNSMCAIFLAFPLLTYTACGSSDDTSDNNTGGSSTGGHSGVGGKGGKGGSGGVNGGEGGESGAAGSAMAGAGLGGSQPGVGGSEAGAAGEGTGGARDEISLTDQQIIKILVNANTGEVSAAEIVKPRLKVAAVVTFAQTMITDHTSAQQQVLALASTKQIAPEPSAISDMLETEAADLLTTLSHTPTAMLDATYMQSQVKMHQEVLNIIDRDLVPSAKDADLKALLGTLRASVAAHLTQAQSIVATL